MTKGELAGVIARTMGLPRKRAMAGVEGMFAAMAQAMAAGERVSLANFGSFRVVWHKSRMGRNITTGDPVLIPPRRVVKFVASRGLTSKMVD